MKQSLQDEYREAASESLRRETPKPDGIDDDEWLGIRTALRILYQAASQEGLKATLDDVREILADTISTEELESLENLIAPSDETDRRQEGVRRRDSFLPNLLGSNGAVDLRLLESVEGGAIEVAPVAVVRLDFDEHIAGQDAITLQVPPTALDELIADLQRLRDQIKHVSAPGQPKILVADWAVEEG